jgi:hypothetical protein
MATRDPPALTRKSAVAQRDFGAKSQKPMINILFLLTPKHLLDAPDPKLACAELVLDVMRRTNNRAVHVDAKLETLILRAAEQNFVPVLDDREAFIGIVRRRSIIEHCLPRAAARRSNATEAELTPYPRGRWHHAY